MSQLTREATADAVRDGSRLPQAFQRRYDEVRDRGLSPPAFELRLADRSSYSIGDGSEPVFTLCVVTEDGYKALSSFDELRVAEAYMDGDIDIEGSLLAALKHRPMLADRHPLKYLVATYLSPLLLGQVKRDKKWIKAHYDNPPEFFELWLDKEIRSYSHGFFAADDEAIEAGMVRKFQYAYDAVGLRPGMRVLDIGGGWGSFVQFAGEQGVEVTSITISDASEAYMKELIARRGLPCRVIKEHFLEYRPEKPFDAIVNLGVTEHLPDYRSTLAQYRRCLVPGGRVYLDAYSGRKHGMPSFIGKWVFEGNTSPLCLERYLDEVAKTPFEVVLIKNDRHNYFLSCKKWAENVEANRDEIVSRFGRHLYRRFVLYLWSAANSFQTGTLSAHRMILQLPAPGDAARAGHHDLSEPSEDKA